MNADSLNIACSNFWMRLLWCGKVLAQMV